MLFCLGFTAQIHAQALVKGTPGTGQSASIVNEVSGRIGIGTASPNAGLQMANVTANRRFVLWEEVNNDHQYYGLGINSGMMRYQVANLGAFHAFFAGNSGTASTELMRIQGSGNCASKTLAYRIRSHK